MIGDQRVDPERLCGSDTCMTRDAVVDGQNELGTIPLDRELDDFRRQPVAVLEAIGHEEMHFPEA